jgi:hypothetical protein
MLLDRVWPARVELSAESESVVEFRWAGPEPDPPRLRPAPYRQALYGLIEGKPDISTLQKTGHLYFGPTRARTQLDCPIPDER